MEVAKSDERRTEVLVVWTPRVRNAHMSRASSCPSYCASSRLADSGVQEAAPARPGSSMAHTLLCEDAQELQSVQLEFEALIRLPSGCKVRPLLLHPPQRRLQVVRLNLRMRTEMRK